MTTTTTTVIGWEAAVITAQMAQSFPARYVLRTSPQTILRLLPPPLK
jgi:hypothetical protein